MSEIESCITSFVDGRVRLRHPSLKRAEDAELVRGFLASLPGHALYFSNPYLKV